jgi:hypothetical protein
MSKELFIQAHEELIEKYLERHPNATEAEAYDKTADGAYDRMTDKLADMIDQARQREKDGYYD